MFSVSPVPESPVPGRHQNQRGAALILALVVFSLVALLASSLSMDFLVAVRRSENQLHGQQASAYFRGAEGLARSALQTDASTGNAWDHISEGWLNAPQELPLDGGIISGTLCDLQGRFNLNNLHSGTPGAYTPHQETFIRLLQTLPLEQSLDQQQAEDITNAVTDWIDQDSDISGVAGAEDGYYSDMEIPYHAGNRDLHSVSELRWVKGITNEIYQALRPHVTALPTDTGINVNTAEPRVLMSINQSKNLQPLSENDALEIVTERDGEIEDGDISAMNDGFKDLSEFGRLHPNSTSPDWKTEHLSVGSDYFLLDATLWFQDREYHQSAILHRDPGSGRIETIARDQGGLGRCEKKVSIQ